MNEDKGALNVSSISFGLTIGFVLFVTTFVIPLRTDDIWWHLKTGQFISETLTIPEYNLFSFTAPEHPWLPHEWMSQLIFFLIFNLLGHKGLIAFGIFLNAAACALVYRIARRTSQAAYLSGLITILASLMMLSNFSLRPYLFGNIFFATILWAMEKPDAGGRLRPILLLLVFGSWANFHSSFIIGLALILLYAAAAFAKYLKHSAQTFEETKKRLIEFSIAMIACVFTPNHVFGLIFPLSYLQKAFSADMQFLTNLSEWRPAEFSSPLGRMITFYWLFVLFAIVGSGRGPRPLHIGLVVAFATFAYTTRRNIPLLGIAAAPVIASHLPLALSRTWHFLTHRTPLHDFFKIIRQKIIQWDRRCHFWAFPLCWAGIFLALFSLPKYNRFSYTAWTGIHHLGQLSPVFFPENLIRHLKKEHFPGKTFNYFHWGGAFIWEQYPREKVFIDARNDCYPVEVMREYFSVHELKEGWRDILERYEIERVAYLSDSALANALRQESEWKVDFEDPNEDSIVFVKISQNNHL